MTDGKEDAGPVDLLPARPETLDTVSDPARTVIVYLERARTWLVQATELDEICEAKSRAAAIQAYVTQKQLGEEAEMAAAELVRRAERRIDQLIQEGQDRGDISSKGRPSENCPRGDNFPTRSPREFTGTGGRARSDMRILGRDSSDEAFDQAVAEARAEQNLSRANVARKLKTSTTDVGAAPPERSAWHHRTRRFDSNRIVREMAIALEGLVSSVALADTAALDQELVDEWADSMKQSLRALTRFIKEITS
jgi:ribosome-binding protein aMBF1 (putative translation factor)